MLVRSTDELSLLTWNVDFAAPLVVRRFQTALSHLEKLVSPHLTSPPPPPTIILLQEVHTSCFKTLFTNTFIYEFAQITNLFSARSYSTLSLMPNSLASLVFSVSRVLLFTETRMQSDCLVVRRPRYSAAPNGRGAESKNIIVNTHLEPLNVFGNRARPKQLEVISRLLTTSEVDAGLVAGDMNAISPSDRNLPEEVGLSDAWFASTARPTDGGHTWGYQPKGAYPPNRLDKILTVGKMVAVDIERVDVELKVEGRDAWVSDHFGLLAKIVLRP
ncbi:Endonuclease/exonuclease/phosphatase [Mycena albidolilacea]|uniref:Endonuclease/exonuclease/phosphatase n=1 Tax=Mycena albidolilacea TaxID=1033008 RepID=A0AAD7A6K4_9AGAR|nr:Endonuclease/exonuclease/phosphatase [Mycena albidolilacea]